MRAIVKSRTLATRERLGGCGARNCDESAVCANCVQCLAHHNANFEFCGFVEPQPVLFKEPDELLGRRTGVVMLVVEDENPALEGKPETVVNDVTKLDLEEISNA